MNEHLDFERTVANHIANEGVTPPSDAFYDELFSRAEQSRQRPQWLAFIKEPPMRISSSLAVGSPTVRVVAIMAATLLLALMVAGAGIAGSRLLAAGPIVVDPSGEGTVTTINDAIEMAGDGDTILVRPGTYAESLSISDDITLLGDGERADIIITGDGTGAPLASIVDSDAEILNLTLGGESGSILVSGGAPTLSGLTFDTVGAPATSPDDGVPSLILDDGTHAQLLTNDFTASSGGIVVRGAAAPLIEGNSLAGGPNLVLEDVADDAVVRDNDIQYPTYNAIEATSAGSYLIEGNQVITDAKIALRIHGPGAPADTTPTISRNTFGNSRTGIEVEAANPTLIENTMYWNSVGIRLQESDAVVQRNIIGDVVGILVGDELRPDLSIGEVSPTITGNFISSTNEAVSLGRDASPHIADNTLCADREIVKANEGADPTIENNDTYESTDLDICPLNLDKLTYGEAGRQQAFDELIGGADSE